MNLSSRLPLVPYVSHHSLNGVLDIVVTPDMKKLTRGAVMKSLEPNFVRKWRVLLFGER